MYRELFRCTVPQRQSERETPWPTQGGLGHEDGIRLEAERILIERLYWPQETRREWKFRE
jgi:hypothetical protein